MPKPLFMDYIHKSSKALFTLLPARGLGLPNNKCGYTYCACSVSKYSASGYSLAVLAVNLLLTKGRIGMDRKRMDENSDYLPKAGNPMNETVLYKIGGTYYEVETSCGGSEPLYDKLARLLKSETFADPADKVEKARYNDGSNLFVGRSLQEE